MSNNIINSDILFGDHTQVVIPNPYNDQEQTIELENLDFKINPEIWDWIDKQNKTFDMRFYFLKEKWYRFIPFIKYFIQI